MESSYIYTHKVSIYLGGKHGVQLHLQIKYLSIWGGAWSPATSVQIKYLSIWGGSMESSYIYTDKVSIYLGGEHGVQLHLQIKI